MNRAFSRHRTWPIVALATAVALLPAACGGARNVDLADAALSQRDVPADWQPAEFDELEGQGLWDVLPQLLTTNSDARLLLRAYEAESGFQGAATILIETEEAAALPDVSGSDSVLAPLSELLVGQDALLVDGAIGADPGAYFAATDLPLPGSLRSRLVRTIEDGYLYSDSVIFTVGRVLAVVTVWYPERDGPFAEVEDVAVEVGARLLSLSDA